MVQAGIDALKAVWHRGAVDADGKTGDGAGIHVEIPQDFFAEVVERGGDRLRPGRIAVGMVFLPKTDLGAQERCRQIVETEILNAGYSIYGWRQVPINVACIGEKANATRPEIEQILICDPEQRDVADRSSATCTSSAGASRSRRSRRRSPSSTSARCRAARSSTRACSSPRA